MGTNYYVYKGVYTDEAREGEHVGKRYAAGAYCWDCRSLLPLSEEKCPQCLIPHQLKQCPVCGATGQKETLETSAAGRELGFNKSRPSPKTGLASASGFIWAIHPATALQISAFIDEYGRLYSNKEFMEVLSECPVQDYTSIGSEFS